MKKPVLIAAMAAAVLLAPNANAARGDSGHLKIIYWQAASILNPYLSGGTKDRDASSLIMEPLARYDETGAMVPWLVEDIPTLANGGFTKDLKTITWKLKKGIKWSDGTDFTSADVVFTADYCMNPDGGCQQLKSFEDISKVEALDSHTVKISFSKPKPFPYGPFVGADVPVMQKAQFKDCAGAKAPECTKENFGPHGTGPFRVVEFKANDVITMEANPHFRDPARPHFAKLTFKGGGDAASAARAALETEEFDYAWNLQIEAEVLAEMEKAGKGKVINAFGTAVERLMVNQTNPDPALGDKRATVEGGPHPYLTDANVRRALSLAIDRQVLVDVGYGKAGKPTCNVIPAPAHLVSTANDECLVQNVELANKLLDDAGWKRGSDGIRAKNGVRLSILYQTSTNSVRQGTQALVKQMWQAIGVETELRNISASVFFGGDQSSPDTFQKFFADIEMYTNTFTGTDAEVYLNSWTCKSIPSPKNNWLGNNMPRYCNAEYDKLAAQLANTGALEDRSALAKKMNDMLMQEGAMIPLIHRGSVAAHVNTLGGVKLNVWDSQMWNVADWHRIK